MMRNDAIRVTALDPDRTLTRSLSDYSDPLARPQRAADALGRSEAPVNLEGTSRLAQMQPLVSSRAPTPEPPPAASPPTDIAKLGMCRCRRLRHREIGGDTTRLSRLPSSNGSRRTLSTYSFGASFLTTPP
jgi:hypothetical protein